MNSQDSRRFDRKLSVLIGAAVLAAMLLSRFYQLTLVQGDSMSPAYRHNQLILVDKRHRNYDRGDVVIFRCEGLQAVLLKRIAACPGDTVQIRGGVLYVNETEDPFFAGKGFDYAGLLERKMTTGENEYWVLGDHAEESRDSRFPEVGTVEEKTIIGKVVTFRQR